MDAEAEREFRTVEHDPAVRYLSVLLTPLSGPAPPGAIVV
jgi:hypothetical protein